MTKLDMLRRAKAGDIIRRLILSWLFSSCFQYLMLPSELKGLSTLDGIARLSLCVTLLMTVLGTAVLTLVSIFFSTAKAERMLIAAVFAILSSACLASSFSPAMLILCIIILTALIIYAVRGANVSNDSPVLEERAQRYHVYITAAACIIFFLFVSAWTVCRVYSFKTPTFDFGIFSQMFHSMSTDGTPITTLERDGPLSHFHVHMSPIYYLLLPFYMLFPFPAALQVLQAAVITSAVIPLWLTAKKHGLSGWERVLMSAALLLFPAFAGGTAYDIHENCFLAPLILWLLYAIDTKNIPLTITAALLTLTVKEDAAVYVAVAALWLTVSAVVREVPDKKARLCGIVTGLALFGSSLLWFFAATGFLSSVGDGVMTYRYSNFMYDGSSSLITVVKSVILSPMKALFECVDSEKLEFIAVTIVPLLGLPLITRKYERYILLIPYILINLMSDYQYQHDIFFQYTFGSTALLVYLTCINLADIKSTKHGRTMRTTLLASTVVVSGIMFSATVIPRADTYMTRYIDRREYYADISQTLELVPDGASVAATTFYTVPLSQRETVYDIKHSSKEHVLSCEYIVLDVSDVSSFKKYETAAKDGFEAFTELLAKEGYVPFGGIDGVIVIYRKAVK